MNSEPNYDPITVGFIFERVCFSILRTDPLIKYIEEHVQTRLRLREHERSVTSSNLVTSSNKDLINISRPDTNSIHQLFPSLYLYERNENGIEVGPWVCAPIYIDKKFYRHCLSKSTRGLEEGVDDASYRGVPIVYELQSPSPKYYSRLSFHWKLCCLEECHKIPNLTYNIHNFPVDTDIHHGTRKRSVSREIFNDFRFRGQFNWKSLIYTGFSSSEDDGVLHFGGIGQKDPTITLVATVIPARKYTYQIKLPSKNIF